MAAQNTGPRVVNPALLPPSVTESKAFRGHLAILDSLKPAAKNWSVGRRNAYAFECQKAIKELQGAQARGELNAKHKGYGFIYESVRQEMATEANVSSDFQILSSQILVTFADIFERFHIEDLVSVFSMTAPRSYIERQQLRYADDSEFYEAGDRITDNIDPDYADSPGECQVANKVKMTNTLEPITAVTKRLAAEWSIQAEDDSRAMFGINLRGSLAGAMADIISRAYQQEHLLAMVADAGQLTTWNETPQGVYTTLDPNLWRNTLYSQAVVDIDVLMRNDADVRIGSNVIAGDATQIARFQRFDQFRSPSTGSFPSVAAQTPNASVSQAGYLQDTPLAVAKMLTEFTYMPANRLLVVRKDDARPARSHAPRSYAASTDLGELTDPETGCRRIGIQARAGQLTTLDKAIGLITITPAA
jgi:hypothetical protein